jgi:hypothetical protein
MDRAAENTQLFQVISISDDILNCQSITATGEVYDAFDLVKKEGRAPSLINRIPSGSVEFDRKLFYHQEHEDHE